MSKIVTLLLAAVLVSAGPCLAPAGAETADKAAPPAPSPAAAPAPDPMAATLQPCLEGSDPEARAVACTGLITGGRLTGRPLGAAYVGRGQAQILRNQLPAAIDDFSQALKIEPEATDALYGRGVTYANLGRDDLALQDFARLLKLAPHDLETLDSRSLIYGRQGRFEAAIADLDTLLAGVDDFEIRLRRAGFLIQLERFDDAIGELNRLVKTAPDSASALYNRGRAELLKRDFDAAAGDFAAAMKNRKDNPYAALRLALANLRRGKSDPAPLEAAAKAVAAEQWPMPVVAFYQGRIDADALLGAANAANAETVAEARYYLGAWSLAKGDKDAARAQFQAALATKADRANLEFIDAGLELKRLK